MPSIAAIICTYNRPKMLSMCLQGLISQDSILSEIVVVDNGAKVRLRKSNYEGCVMVTHIMMGENVGPATGFTMGMRYAYDRGHDFLWLFNDDAVPSPSALSECIALTGELSSDGGVIAHNAVRTDTTDPEFVDIFNFNGALISRNVVTLVGYPRSQFFMCYYEQDYSIRIRAAGLPIINVPGTSVYHAYAGTAVDGRTPPWRGYYQTRNELAAALSQRSLRAMRKWAVRQIRFGYGAFVGRDQVRERLRYRLLGAWHALRGIDGRTVEPTGTGGH